MIDSITMMTKDEIQKKLEEYCEFKVHKIPKNDIDDIAVDLFLDEDRTETEILKDGVNITEPKKLVRVKPCENQCPDCKCKVVDRKVDYKWKETERKKYWRAKCSCGLVLNPFTNEFSVDRYHAVDLYAAYEKSSTPPKFDKDSSYWRFLEKKYTK